MNEFDIIKNYFDWGGTANVVLGVGDDGAIIDVPSHSQLVSSTDTFIEGVHFLAKTAPQDIAYKALAVNLSDLAAMGAVPKWFSLGLTLASVDPVWLQSFASTLRQLAAEFNLCLIGGDTSRGQLSINIHILGIVPKNKALLRSGAKIGDVIFVSNTLGCAALARKQYQQKKATDKYLLSALNRPYPQIKLGQSLRGIASACIDVSDGLLADLGHLLNRSGVGAEIDPKKIPLSPAVSDYVKQTKDWCLPLAGGDDYQLCFTVPAHKMPKFNALKTQFCLSEIGLITEGEQLQVKGVDTASCRSYTHF